MAVVAQETDHLPPSSQPVSPVGELSTQGTGSAGDYYPRQWSRSVEPCYTILRCHSFRTPASHENPRYWAATHSASGCTT